MLMSCIENSFAGEPINELMRFIISYVMKSLYFGANTISKRISLKQKASTPNNIATKTLVSG